MQTNLHDNKVQRNIKEWVDDNFSHLLETMPVIPDKIEELERIELAHRAVNVAIKNSRYDEMLRRVKFFLENNKVDEIKGVIDTSSIKLVPW